MVYAFANNVSKNISKNLSGKYGQNLLDSAKISGADALKTTSKRSSSENSGRNWSLNW